MLESPQLREPPRASPEGDAPDPLPLWRRRTKQILIGVIGGTVMVLGIVMIVLPGPALLVIPAGLAILATEFAFARRWLKSCRSFVKSKMRR